MPPPLSYAIPSFHPAAFDDLARPLARLRALGFRWVTFTPAWTVSGDAAPRLAAHRTPPLGKLARAVARAAGHGFHVRLEPHLEWECTLSGGPYRWRRDLVFAPAREENASAGLVVGPLTGILAAAAAMFPERRFVLTLGSELDESLLALAQGPGGWEELPKQARASAPRLAFSQKINHDAFIRRGGALPARARRFLAALDHAAISFYPPLRLDRPRSWWREDTRARHVAEAAEAFALAAAKIAEPARAIAPLAVGEFGLGSADVSAPWRFNCPDPGAIAEVRRKYYLGFLEFLRGSGGLFAAGPATFWTAGHFDVLGVLPGGENFRDEGIEAAVGGYNSAIIGE